MATRYIRLPNGKPVSLTTYCRAWRALLTAPTGAQVAGFDYFPTEAADVLRRLRAGMHDRINRHIPGYGAGRKWADNWQLEARRTAWAVNTPRLVVRWAPRDLRARLAHRLDA